MSPFEEDTAGQLTMAFFIIVAFAIVGFYVRMNTFVLAWEIFLPTTVNFWGAFILSIVTHTTVSTSDFEKKAGTTGALASLSKSAGLLGGSVFAYLVVLWASKYVVIT